MKLKLKLDQKNFIMCYMGVGIWIFLRNTQKSILLFHEIVACFFLEMPRFQWSEIFEMQHFSQFQNQIGKWDIWRFSNIIYVKWVISRKNHVIDFKTGKEPKINMFLSLITQIRDHRTVFVPVRRVRRFQKNELSHCSSFALFAQCDLFALWA